jgi:hypothetical protein
MQSKDPERKRKRKKKAPHPGDLPGFVWNKDKQRYFPYRDRRSSGLTMRSGSSSNADVLSMLLARERHGPANNQALSDAVINMNVRSAMVSPANEESAGIEGRGCAEAHLGVLKIRKNVA